MLYDMEMKMCILGINRSAKRKGKFLLVIYPSPSEQPHNTTMRNTEITENNLDL